MSNISSKQITVFEAINLAYLMPMGYDVFQNLESHKADSTCLSYLMANKNIAFSGILQNQQISFIEKHSTKIM